MPCISPAIGYIFAPNILANIFRVGDCLVIVYGVAWLTPSGYPGSCPREPQDSVQMCGDSDTGGGSGHWRLWDTRPGHPLPSPHHGSVWEHSKFLPSSPQLQPLTVTRSKQTSPQLNKSPTQGFVVTIVMNKSFNSGCIIRLVVCVSSSNPLEHEVLNSRT